MLQSTLLTEGYTIINTNLSLWTGKAKMRVEDLPAEVVANMPPAELMSLGSKTLIDPKLLSPMSTIKTTVHRFMTQWGVKFLGGFMVAQDNVSYINDELRTYQAQFESKVAELVAAYDSATEQWCNQHPLWAPMIRAALPSASKIAGKFKFDWCVYTINPQDEYTDQQLASVADAGIVEMAELIGDVCERTFPIDRTSPISKRTIGALDSIAEKARHLSFLHPYFTRIESMVEELKTYTDSAKIRLILRAMSDPIELERYCAQQQSAADTFSDMIGALAAPTTPAPEPTIAPEPVVPTPVLPNPHPIAEPAPEPVPVFAPEPQPATPTEQEEGLQFSPEFMTQFGGLL